MHTLDFNSRFEKLSQLKSTLHEKLPNHYISGQVVYIQPGHGAKGRQLWLNNDVDLDNMYKECLGKKEIMFWCLSNSGHQVPVDDSEPAAKRPCVATAATSKAELLTQKMSEVDEIVTKLTDQHSQNYSIEQLRAWAHLIQISPL